MHEGNFPCSWQSEDLVEKEERIKKVNDRVRKEKRKNEMREMTRNGEKEENETVTQIIKTTAVVFLFFNFQIS